MTPAEVYVAQLKLTAALAAALTPTLWPLIGTQLTSSLITTLAKALLPDVQQSRAAQQQLATLSYREAKKAALPSESPIAAPPVREYTADDLQKGLERVLSTETPLDENDIARAIRVADQHSRNAYRNQTVAFSLADEDVLGWARIDPEPPTCVFCTMLISRGPVYTTAETAGEQNHYHGGCTCVPALVFRSEKYTWPGRDKFLDAEALWKSSGGDFKKFRRIVNKRNGTARADTNEASEKSAKDPNSAAVKKRAADLKAARAQLKTLENLQPKSESAKDYKAKQLAVLKNRIAKLTDPQAGEVI
ncbi:hypothetical protein FPZ12_029550 [Amycolatopsis acidicola]|uniref:Capsid maturation protease n=1 Tax=Amycolatopsis acidicola TaxID=2596893 RepID=A0A5N0UXR8_9PSEU|nr:hypothetical protein [Amycolatopsis acidicola]KAA9155543.1 hypothetical protein FPZ12_029550 [Amycolatopsis acidicola]